MSKRYGLYLTDRRQAALGPQPMRRILQLIDAEIERIEQNESVHGSLPGGVELVHPDETGTYMTKCWDCKVWFPFAGSDFCNQCLEVSSE